MKKYVILTSILALAACGGGSGGGHGGNYSDVPNTVEKPFTPIKDRIASSNAEITGMVSNSEAQVVIYVANKLGSDAENVGLGNVARTATQRGAFSPSASAGDLNYDKAKELMELAQWLGDKTTTHEDIVELFNKSKADQNKIKSALKLLDDMYCYVGGSANETARRILERRANKDFDKPMAEIKEKSEIMTLDNVKFNVAGFNDGEVDTDYTLSFGLDADGKIDKLVMNYMNDDGAEEHTNASRQTITNDHGEKVSVFYADVYKFRVKGYTTDSLDYKIEDRAALRKELENSLSGKSDDIKNTVLSAFDAGQGEWISETHQHQLDLYGNKMAKNLKYMDFGYDILTRVGDDEKDYSIVFGGYDIKKIDPSNITDTKLEFAGTAIGAAAYSYGDDGYDSMPVETEQNSATLTFENGKETLVMPFKNYYTVTVDRENDTATLSFTDYKGDKDGYKFIKETGISTADKDDLAHVIIKYYGDNGTPTEAGGIISHEEWTNGLKSFEAAFGGTRK